MANPWDSAPIVQPPEAGGGNPWDSAPIVQKAAPAPATATPAAPIAPPPKQEDPSLLSKFGRQAGLTARAGLEGFVSPITMVGDVAGGVANKVLPKGAQIPSVSGQFSKGLTEMGLPTPSSPTERVVGDIAGAVSGAGSGVSLARAGMKAASPVLKGVAGALAEAPASQAVSAAGGSGAAGVTREEGGGVGAQTTAGLLGGMSGMLHPGNLPKGKPKTFEEKTQQDNARKAIDSGYVVPPHMVTPSLTSSAAGSAAGKIKTQQEASIRNNSNTNSLARKDMGMAENTMLDDDAFKEVRSKAGKAYQKIADVQSPIIADKQFLDDVKALTGTGSHRAEIKGSNPELDRIVDLLTKPKMVPSGSMSAGLGVQKVPKNIEFSTTQIIEYVKELRNQATANLKSMGDNAPKAHAAGLAQRDAANSLDDLLERNLQNFPLSKTDIENYREARKAIAKSHDYEAVTNKATGNVNAHGLGALQKKGKPISGEGEKIASFARAFRQASIPVEQIGGVHEISKLDFAGTMAAVATGHPGVAASFSAGPLARNALLSDWYQNQMLKPRAQTTVPFTGMAAGLGKTGILGGNE